MMRTLLTVFRKEVLDNVRDRRTLASALIMPSCGCGSLPVETAERVIDLTGQVARTLQERYGP